MHSNALIYLVTCSVKRTHTNKIFTVFTKNVYSPTLISKGFNLFPQQSPLFTT